MKDQINIDIDAVAKLASLRLDGELKTKLSEDVVKILNAFDRLSELDTDGVQPLVHPTKTEAHYRKDKLTSSQSTETSMSRSPQSAGNNFKVPPVV